ncbi:hypothetical protein [Actinophytocola algeriensis]|uniref:Uncharacterized protein n=1 Tax=Actinophytocola algeriensis TaxID=1768010 RepID=A0A7W7VFH9_9PSEU|nr:hypothetical protein [Actinophytocola algeriensis]MBB4908337.1 hypothetical protein [Actinophytocola algeriensis]MBE1480367.1 hypothetical protein [Actinophytocola algeriensis]
MTVDLDDFEDAEDLAELLGLPEQLPGLVVPPLAELAAVARESELMRRVAALVAWVGERREVTEEGDLTEPDAAEAAEHLGATPAELLLYWEAALATDLVVVSADDSEADANADLWPTGEDQEDLGTWTAAFTQILPSVEIDAELAGDEDLDLAALGSLALPMFLMRGAGVPMADLRESAHEIAAEHLEDDTAWDAWVAAHGDPAEALLNRLIEHGAVEVDGETARLTPLGLFAMREELVEGGIEIPLLPPVADMTAADLLSAVGGLTEDELTGLTTEWLDGHEPADLLAAASEATPQARVHATTVLGDVPGTQWESVLDDEMLRPYALVALDRELAPAELALLLVDLLAATADQLGTYDEVVAGEMFVSIVPPGQEQEVLAAAWRLPHPQTYEVLTLIGAHHPDKQVAKAARTAAHKARSAG